VDLLLPLLIQLLRMVLQGMAMKFARVSLSTNLRTSFSSSLLSSHVPIHDRPLSTAHQKSTSPSLHEELHSPHPYQQRCFLFPINTPNKGVGGAYFIKDGDKPAAVFKPLDEEAVPDEEETHDVSLGKEIKPGLLYGEGYLKEIAAYLLDRQHFHGVPTTVLFGVKNPVIQDTETVGPKFGSLQQYVSHSCTADEVGWSSFPVDEVHKIGILDCRVLNNDRHLGNILVVKEKSSPFSLRSSCRLVPIDHGLCLPSSLSGGYFEWLSFPQSKQPFSKPMLEYIESTDVDADIQMLEKRLPLLRRECLDTLKICTMFLQRGAKAGLNLFEIGCLMSRYENMDEPCVLETLCDNVNQVMKEMEEGVPDAAASRVEYWEVLAAEMDTVLYNFCNNKINM